MNSSIRDGKQLNKEYPKLKWRNYELGQIRTLKTGAGSALGKAGRPLNRKRTVSVSMSHSSVALIFNEH